MKLTVTSTHAERILDRPHVTVLIQVTELVSTAVIQEYTLFLLLLTLDTKLTQQYFLLYIFMFLHRCTVKSSVNVVSVPKPMPV